jgi:transposase
MEGKKTSKSFSAEVRERAVRMVLDHKGESGSEWAAIRSIAAKIGCTAESLRRWIRRSDGGGGAAPDGLPADLRERLKALERENRELRQANGILRKASAYSAQAELDRRFKPCSRSSTITAGSTGSSRSARFCRSLRRPLMPSGRCAAILAGRRPASGATRF